MHSAEKAEKMKQKDKKLFDNKLLGLTFQLKCEETKGWFDWLYIGNSKYQPNELGLFAANDLNKGAFITFYTGPKTWEQSKDTKCHLNQPTIDVMRLLGTPITSGTTVLRNVDGFLYSVSPIKGKTKEQMFMGAHYIQKEKRNILKIANCFIDATGAVFARKQIKKGTSGNQNQ